MPFALRRYERHDVSLFAAYCLCLIFMPLEMSLALVFSSALSLTIET